MTVETYVRPACTQRAIVAVVAAQFFSSLADNALLMVAIGLLLERHAAAWMTPALRLFFYVSFVLLAPFAGAIADGAPKSRVMFTTNLVKLGGCLLLVTQLHPLLAYALIGCGAAAYSPAKYGILPELLPSNRLVAANAWIEISTVVSILLGVVLGSFLIDPGSHMPRLVAGDAANAAALLTVLYAWAAVCTALIPTGAARQPDALARPARLIQDFRRGRRILWRDPHGRISMAVTSLFWAIAAALQFIVLGWATQSLHMTLAQAGLMQGVVALGMIGGAAGATRYVAIGQAVGMLPAGVLIGVLLMVLPLVDSVLPASALLLAIGALAGLLLVPMNALMQDRGNALMATGQSVSIQNFSECLASLVMLGVYGALLAMRLPLSAIVVGLGLLVTVTMLLLITRQQTNATATFAADDMPTRHKR